MGLRGGIALAVVLALAVLGWWHSPLSPRIPPPPHVEVAATSPASASMTMPSGAADATTAPAPWEAGANPRCPMPPRVGDLVDPLQSPSPANFPALRIEDATLTPLAGFSIDARVLSRRDYAYGREAHYSPTDLALGWGRMREDAVLDQLNIQQRGRWYHYTWHEPSPPIAAREIARSSANMHLIPADATVAAALARVRKDQRVRIDGWLVELKGADGWSWRSSLSRDDQGAGGCEVIYACGVTPL